MAGAAALVALAALGWQAVNAPGRAPADAVRAVLEMGEGPRLEIDIEGQAKGRVVIALAADVAPNHAE
ncbi:MAG: peptidylprolyl isomerase, partial [Alphaproteobacteria bacterium]